MLKAFNLPGYEEESDDSELSDDEDNNISHHKEFFDVLPVELEIANATCWNSQLKMIRSILAVDQQKLDSLQDAPKLTLYEKNIC